MANTYTQLYVHIVFAVSGRQSLIHPSHNDELQKYITGIVTNKGHKMFAINNMPDHLHLFLSMKPSESISDLVRDIKSNSSRFIREKGWTRLPFSWQEGFGAFTYAKSQTEVVVRYVMNQQEHHRTNSFREEYIEMLERFEIPYDERYLFTFIAHEDVMGALHAAPTEL
ncbi:MAG TPA: IS200/IS605 family transposase [Candidatus Kapabacteria bacterium]|nr:IS200/IS605 family transposase [Candidatus Kapabacteria bacterium]